MIFTHGTGAYHRASAIDKYFLSTCGKNEKPPRQTCYHRRIREMLIKRRGKVCSKIVKIHYDLSPFLSPKGGQGERLHLRRQV